MTDLTMPQIAERMFGTPLLVEPAKAAVIARAFAPRLLGTAAEVHVSSAVSPADSGGTEKRAGSILHEGMSEHLKERRAGFIRHGPVAVIEVVGSLVRRGSWLGQSSGMTSYEGLRGQLKAAAADPEVKAIALEFDTPGGEAAGAFELGDLVREIRETKPVYGFCAEYAYSAGYALASQCNYLTVTEFGGAGSIGVIMMHVEYSDHLKKEGVTVNIIRAGQQKAKGNSVEPLPDELREEWQSESEAMRVQFAQLVGKGRGDRFDMAAALKTEAKAYSGTEAVRLGLADRVADPKKAFDAMVASIVATGAWDGTVPVPAAKVTNRSSGCTTGAQTPHAQKEADMPDQVKEPEAQGVTGETKAGEGKTSTASPTAAETSALKCDAAAITKAVARAGLSAEFAAELISSNATQEQASDAIIDKLADKKAGADGGDIVNEARVVHDGVDRMKAGMSKALLKKAGVSGGEANEFSSMSLREMARHTLQVRGLDMRFGGVQQLVGAAFVPTMAGGLHSTSDFGEVLADVANKSMLMAYQEAEETFEQFTKRTTLTDFKPTKRVGTGLFPDLSEVGEAGEFKYGTMGDFGETIALLTYGKLFAITRQAIINDDLGAFTTVPMKAGRAAKRKIGDLVFAVLNANAAMSDGTALFHADHNNLASSGAAPSETTIDAALVAMAAQSPRGTDADSSATLNIQPKYLISGYTHRSAVLAALMSEKTPDTTGSKSQMRYNTVYQAAEPIFDNRVAGNAWYMAADPMTFDTIEVAYLDGVTEPYIDQQDGWTVDGTEFKVREDVGVKATAWEGLYKNAGS
ncbi:Putative signal peptide peptidase SppA [Roseovarius sp. THAF27]|uniref:S49 family peptidase n=1 Tax=Roseovarius sp. THAF27 TaxID=2587850 RepID=UPI0012A8FFCA|nr:S49 family peptidase [Roseovarius sp. THAF27]QFT81168.1 Putative signal peptide peptidase SppA [Roseovarius sp. THAF27]